MANDRLDDLKRILGVDLITNRWMTIDEIISALGCTVDDDGEILDSYGCCTGVWYDEID